MQRQGLSDSTIESTSGENQEVFEKRPRRKTREDKYDLKRKLISQPATSNCPHGDDERNSKQPTKKRRKMALAGYNVMEDFTSEAVLADRVTVNPPCRRPLPQLIVTRCHQSSSQESSVTYGYPVKHRVSGQDS